MRITHRRIIRPTLTAAIVVVAALGTASPAVAQTIDAPRPEPALENLSAQEQELFHSGQPAVLRIDPATGGFLSVEPAPAAVQPFAVYSNCSGDRACWRGCLSPHIWYGFDGSGVTPTPRTSKAQRAIDLDA